MVDIVGASLPDCTLLNRTSIDHRTRAIAQAKRDLRLQAVLTLTGRRLGGTVGAVVKLKGGKPMRHFECG
jgi:hypothetical protein